MTEKEIKSLVGAALYARMKAFAKKAKKENLSPAEVKKAFMAKFGKHIKIMTSVLCDFITGMK